jgi:hypothetical protein
MTIKKLINTVQLINVFFLLISLLFALNLYWTCLICRIDGYSLPNFNELHIEKVFMFQSKQEKDNIQVGF